MPVAASSPRGRQNGCVSLHVYALLNDLPFCRPGLCMPRSRGQTEEAFVRVSAAPRGDLLAMCQTRQIASRSGTHTNERDRKSTRLNSNHVSSSYAVFRLKKKTNHVRST